MKYYKNLIKMKKYKLLFICFIWFLLGVFICYLSFVDVATNGIQYNDHYHYYDLLTTIISSTNLGMIIIGFMNMYFALVFPTWSPYAQDDNDYIVKSVKDNLYIKYKKYEYLVKKETFSPTKLFFWDMNKKFVTMSVGYRVYNYVVSKSKNLIEHPINDANSVTRFDVIDKFSDVRKATLDDKKLFLNTHKIYNKNRIWFLIISIILGSVVAFNLIGLIGGLLDNDFNITEIIVTILLTIFVLFLQKSSIKAMKKNKILYSKVMDNDLYIINCMVFDKKNMDTSDEHVYYIKITDGNYVVDEWIKVSKELYNQNINNINLYVLDKYENEIFMF